LSLEIKAIDAVRGAGSWSEGEVRRDFPALAQRPHGGPLVYLDSAATALKPRAVIDAVVRVYEEQAGSVHRGAHELSRRATGAYEAAREEIRRSLNATSIDEIVFVRSTTEALNLVASSWALPRLQAGDRVVVSGLEHHSNLLPWHLVCERTGAELVAIPLDDRGEIALDRLDAALGPRPRIVALAHVSNVTGSLLPVAAITRLAHERGAVVVVDGAQAAPHLDVDVQALDCDFYALSGHKLYGPSGVGVLFGKRELLAKMAPYQVGGGMVSRVDPPRITYRDAPHRFEAGTPNVEGAVGLAAAFRYLRGLGRAAIERHERELMRHAIDVLAGVPGLRVLGAPERRIAAISFTLAGVHPHDVATVLDGAGVAVRAGALCAQPVLDHFGVTAVTRASLGVYTRASDLDALAAALHEARHLLG
jgi:cysteine desulfurase/selenocysteine lyase